MTFTPHIAILTGGNGSERAVSLLTAQAMCDSLTRLGIEFTLIDVAETDWLDQVLQAKATSAFIAVHGTFGEDGGLQSILEEANIPHTGSCAEVAQITFDKKMTKERVAEIKVRSPREFQASELTEYDLPVVIKPTSEGSSFGVTIVHELSQVHNALMLAGENPLIEECIVGQELTCGVTNLFGEVKALPLVEIVPKNAFFDYESKYVAGMADEICPAEINPETTEQIQRLSEDIFRHLGIGQYCRIDWMLRDGLPYFLEVNTIPGMTPTSLITKEIAAAGITFDDFMTAMLSRLPHGE